MKRHLAFRRPKSDRQQTFDFLERSARRQRWFKRVILWATFLVLGLVAGLMPRGRHLIAASPSLARRAARLTVGLPTPRAEIDDEWKRFRLQGIADSHRALIGIYQEAPPAYQALMRYAGLDPDHGVLRWGNFNRTLLLPSTVFEADDTGRSYRLRSCTESIWLREVTIKNGVLAFFLVPDRPDLGEAIRGTAAIPVQRSRQSTNSWGLRGPEPDMGAPVRGIVLGDSFMQGFFIGDDETPPECLKRYLEAQLNTRASILNTGHLGYSPEQYYYSLVAFADRFSPQFVVVSVCVNDFGDAFEVWHGKGDWDEGKYWLDRIAQLCTSRNWPCLFVSVPFSSQMLGRRRTGGYPGAVSNILEANAIKFLDPTDAFVDAHLDLIVEAEHRGQPAAGCPLFNEDIKDGHFSALGADVWARAVGRRLLLLLEQNNKRQREESLRALVDRFSAPSGSARASSKSSSSGRPAGR